MPAVNPKYECEPCRRGNHAWCTMENQCMCPNSWDGEGWRENIEREAAKERQRAHTTPATGAGASSRVRPLVGAGRLVWICADCGFESRWWKGSERFKYCTDCERRHLEIQWRELREQLEKQGVVDDGRCVDGEGGAGQGAQAPLPLSVHRDGR